MAVETFQGKVQCLEPSSVTERPQLISRIVVEDYGSYQRIQEWYSGHHPELGSLTFGWQGEPQTYVERDVFRPIGVIEASPNNK